MPIKVTCTQCTGILHAPDDSSGKRGRCPTCGTVLTIIGEYVGPVATSPQFGAPPVGPPRPAATTPVTNPWGSLPGGPDEAPGGVPQSGPAAPPPRPTYDLAKDPIPPRPGPGGFPMPSEPIPATHGSRVPPDPRKISVQDPFAKPAKPDDEQTRTNARWARAYRGLGWIRTGILFCLLGTLAYAAVPILQVFDVKLPNEKPGFLKIDDYSQAEEIRLVATSGGLLLGLLCVVIGRIGVSGLPAVSGARSVARCASLATIAALAGFIGVAVITGLAMKDGGFMPQVTPKLSQLASAPTLAEKVSLWGEGVFLSGKETTGQIQGFAAAALVTFGLLAEVWFVAALGRMAAALRHPSAAGRVNRFLILIGGLTILKVGIYLAARVYYASWFDANVWTKWEQLDEKSKAVGPLAGVAVLGLVLALLYWRMIGGVRNAIRENVDLGA